jgi:hypothetical protein
MFKTSFPSPKFCAYDGISKSFRTGRLEWELQMAQLSATGCNCIAILWVSLVSFAVITFCVASQRVLPRVRVYFIIDSFRKLLDTSSYVIPNQVTDVSEWLGLRNGACAIGQEFHCRGCLFFRRTDCDVNTLMNCMYKTEVNANYQYCQYQS